MRERQSTLRDQDVQEPTVTVLQQQLRLQDYSKKTSALVLGNVLLFAAARLSSIFAACQRLRDVPSDDTPNAALSATLPRFAEWQRRVNRALAATLPKALKQKRPGRLRLAIDLTLIPYHGQPEADSTPRRGRRRLNLERLRFKTLLFWILQVVVAAYGTKGETLTEREYQT